MQALYVALVFAFQMGLGFAAPFTFCLTYVWVDTAKPQDLSWILSSTPVALICAIGAIGAFFTTLKRVEFRPSKVTYLSLMMACWVSVTLYWAVAPYSASLKWDWAFKTILFSAFMPFVLTTRVRIEAFFQVYMFALAIIFVPYGVKTIISGGGYGRALSVFSGSSGISESSTAAAIAVMCVPILNTLRKQSILLPSKCVRSFIYPIYILLCLAASIGTYARTGLVAIALLGLLAIARSKRKFSSIIIIILLIAVGSNFTEDAWRNRMSTVENYDTESSALGRILVWKWTLNFALDNPLGGGFNSYIVDKIEFPSLPGLPMGAVIHGKAFHNIYFEVLGEHGWPGLALFLGLIGFSALDLWKVMRWAKSDSRLDWCAQLSGATLTSLAILAVTGNFIGIAFQPMLWYLFALSSCLSGCARRIKKLPVVDFLPSVKVQADKTTPTRDLQDTRHTTASYRFGSRP